MLAIFGDYGISEIISTFGITSGGRSSSSGSRLSLGTTGDFGLENFHVVVSASAGDVFLARPITAQHLVRMTWG